MTWKKRILRWVMTALAGGMLFSGSSGDCDFLGSGGGLGNFAQDNDGDGFTDAQEMLLGTNPDNAGSHP